MSSNSETVKVDIWSDVQCPWCYIGKRKFEAAVEQTGIPVEVEYHSFELAPDTPVDYNGHTRAVPRRAQGPARRHRPPDDRARQGHRRRRRAGLRLRRTCTRPTRVKAHELLHYAKAHGKQLEMKERLLKAYFLDGGHVGRVEDLADFAAELGLDRDDVVRALGVRAVPRRREGRHGAGGRLRHQRRPVLRVRLTSTGCPARRNPRRSLTFSSKCSRSNKHPSRQRIQRDRGNDAPRFRSWG